MPKAGDADLICDVLECIYVKNILIYIHYLVNSCDRKMALKRRKLYKLLRYLYKLITWIYRVIFIGSEPSLGSRNGNQSSVTASKRTLTSQENLSPANRHDNTTPVAEVSHNATSDTAAILPDLSDLPADYSLPDSPAKTPSYLRLSCAVSGYNKYNSYNTPPQKHQTRIKVLKKSESGSDLSSERENDPSVLNASASKSDPTQNESKVILGQVTEPQPITNGHDDVTESDVTDGSRIITSSKVADPESRSRSRPVSSDLGSDSYAPSSSTGAAGEGAMHSLTSGLTSATSADSGCTENGVLSMGDLQLDLGEEKVEGVLSPDTPAKVQNLQYLVTILF